jgi:hypothetical protein
MQNARHFMANKKSSLPAEPHEQAANDGVAAELSDEAIHNLTGFFDVLIQMDFALKQRNEQGKEHEDFLQGATDKSKQVD